MGTGPPAHWPPAHPVCGPGHAPEGRAGQGVTLLSCLAVALGTLGIYTLHISPILSLDAEDSRLPTALALQRIEHLPLEPAFWQRLPEFLTPSAETAWWQLHEQVYRLLRAQDVVWVEIQGKGGRPSQMQAQVGFLPVLAALKQVGLIYFAALIYVISAILVFRHHRAPPGTLLAFFLLAGALYLLSSAPVASRPLTLHPTYFKILMSCVYTAAGGMITLVHFALVFPAPKALLRRWPWIPALLYGYFGLTVTLYLAGLTAFGTTFPFFCLSVGLMAWALCDTLVHERDRFLKQQIGLSLMAPVLVSLFLIGLNLFPVIVGLPPLPFTYFAFLSLILPFALPLAINNLALYQERLVVEQNAQKERAQISADLHDMVKNNLTSIAAAAEVALLHLDRDRTSVKQRLQSIHGLAAETGENLTKVLMVIEDDSPTWATFCGDLRSWGREWIADLGLEFDLEIAPAVFDLPPPALRLRAGFYLIYREALTNARQHSRADRVSGTLTCCGDRVICELQDNGIGFDLSKVPEGHYGLRNMQRRARALGGHLTIAPQLGRGTHIRFALPWKANSSKLEDASQGELE